MIGSFFMTIFVLAPPEFYLRKKCRDKNDAKSRDFEMAVKTLFIYEKGWGKFLWVTNEYLFNLGMKNRPLFIKIKYFYRGGQISPPPRRITSQKPALVRVKITLPLKALKFQWLTRNIFPLLFTKNLSFDPFQLLFNFQLFSDHSGG